MEEGHKRGITPDVINLDNATQEFWDGEVQNWNPDLRKIVICAARMSKEERKIFLTMVLSKERSEKEEKENFFQFCANVSVLKQETLKKIEKAILKSYKDELPNG